MKHKRLGDMLISMDLLTEEQLMEALKKQKESVLLELIRVEKNILWLLLMFILLFLLELFL